MVWAERVEGDEHGPALDCEEAGPEPASGPVASPEDSGGYGRALIERALLRATGAQTECAFPAPSVRFPIDIAVRSCTRRGGPDGGRHSFRRQEGPRGRGRFSQRRRAGPRPRPRGRCGPRPLPTATEAMASIAAVRPDAAVVGTDLRGEVAHSIAYALAERGVPFAFATGYSLSVLPARYAAASRCDKPVGVGALAQALFQGSA